MNSVERAAALQAAYEQRRRARVASLPRRASGTVIGSVREPRTADMAALAEAMAQANEDVKEPA